jgi:LPS export ABC transporter protein LptC
VKFHVLLAAAAALVLVLLVRWQFPDDRSSRITPSLPDPRFDYTLTDFQARFHDEGGQLELILSGPRLEHDATSKVATVESPNFHIQPEAANWLGQAEQGLLLREADELVLEGDVVLEHPGPDGPLKIFTQRLRHSIGQRTIEAPMPTEMRGPDSFIQAGRVVIRLDDETLEFFDNVQGELLPRRTDP